MVTPGTVRFLPPERVRANRILGGGARFFEVRLAPRWLERLDQGSLALDAPGHFSDGSLAALALRLCREARETDAASPRVMEGLALELLGLCFKEEPQQPVPQLALHLRVMGMTGQVALLVRVRCQVVQQEAFPGLIHRVFPLVGADHHVAVAGSDDFAEDGVAVGGGGVA
jgi:hypothetical protein